MKPQTPVSTIMIKNIIGLTISDDLDRAEMLLKRHKIKHIPVVSGGVIIGMVSYTDLMRTSHKAAVNGEAKHEGSLVYNGYTVEQIMSKDVVTISVDTTIKEATGILSKREFHALPVVDNGELVGIITTRDLLKYFFKQY